MANTIFEDAGFAVPGAEDNEKVVGETRVVPTSGAPTIFEAAGFKVPTSKGAPPTVDSVIPTPESFAADVARYGVNNHPAKSTLQQIHETIDPATLLATGAKNTYHDMIENAVAAKGLARQGLLDISKGDYLPTMPSRDPSTWAPGGLAKTAAGALGFVSSPISGAVNALVSRPVTALTGNPDIGDRAGFVVNALLPTKSVGKVASKVSSETRGVNALVDTIGAENVPETVAALRANPRLTIADTSDPVRITTQGLMAGGTPDVQDAISKAVRQRNAQRLDATNTAFTNTMGPSPDVPAMVEGLKQRAREAGQKAIQPALAGAKAVDLTPVIAAIDKEVQPGIAAMKSGLPLSPRQEELWRLRNQLIDPNTGETLFDANRLHQIQSQTGDKTFNLQKSADGWTRDVGNGLRDVNEKLIDAIDAASGKAYRPARAKFKDAKDISEAFESGFDTLKNRAGLDGALADSPAAFKQWIGQATPEEVVARRLGTRADIDRRINGVKNGALAGETVTAIPYNQEKLKMLFGDQEASRLIRVMQDSTREAQTNAAILAGSKTAETRAAAERIKVREVGGGNPLQYVAPVAAELIGQSAGIPFLGMGASLAGKGALMSGQKIGKMMDIARNYQFAKGALSTGVERDNTINALLSHPRVVRELEKRSNALTSP